MESSGIKIGIMQFTPFQSICLVIGSVSMLVCAVSSFLPWTRFIGSYFLGFQSLPEPYSSRYNGIPGLLNIIASVVILFRFVILFGAKTARALDWYLIATILWTSPFSIWLVVIHFELGPHWAFGITLALVASLATAFFHGILYFFMQPLHSE